VPLLEQNNVYPRGYGIDHDEIALISLRDIRNDILLKFHRIHHRYVKGVDSGETDSPSRSSVVECDIIRGVWI
jgi:hypothetical protein